MSRPRSAVMVLTALAATVALAGCGGDGGATTTTAAETGVVTIQTDTRVTNTGTGVTVTDPGEATTPSGITGNAQLDAAITAIAAAIRGTVADLGASADPTTLTAQVTTRAEAFDRAVQRVHDVVPEDGAQTNTQAAIADAAPALSDAYRTFTDAAAQAADSNDAAALKAAKAKLQDALHAFDEAAGTGS